MDNIIKYLQSLGLVPVEIINTILTEQGLKVIDEKQAMQNVELVIKLGYPREDISTLISINPSFLVRTKKTILDALEGIDDVEEALKENPFLI